MPGLNEVAVNVVEVLPRAHTYEVTKIEVLNAETPSTSNGTVAEQKVQLRIAILLQGTEIHKKSGERNLEESKKAEESIRYKVHESKTVGKS